MTEEKDAPRIHIDSDWKEEAQREKERLTQQEREQAAAQQPVNKPNFAQVVNLIGMQAMIGLSGLKGPTGETVPPDPEVARFHIDMLEVLEQKTAGNLTDDEKRALSATLHELRMTYVQVVNAIATPPDERKNDEK
jgi:hypothetical protein